MTVNPPVGVALHAVGGFAAGSFYSPLKRVRAWHWETSWLAMGLAAWLAAPWIMAFATTEQLLPTLQQAWHDSRPAFLAAMGFGMIWGVGNLTFGLSIRYLGVGLGMTIALGACMLVGSIEPAWEKGKLHELVTTTSGGLIAAGMLLCLLGVIFCGIAGHRRENEFANVDGGDLSSQAGIPSGALTRGLIVAITSGVLSAGFAIALSKGAPIADLAVAHGTNKLFSNNPVLIVILLGGFVSNAAWCLLLNFKNRSFGEYVPRSHDSLINYAFSWLGGITWYAQFFFYGMGTTKLGEKYDFSSWSIHMAFIIFFSNLWGIAFHEWRGASSTTRAWVWAGIVTLLLSTVVIGWGNSLAVLASALPEAV